MVKLNFPKKFNLEFTFFEIFQEERFHFYLNLRNNVFEKFKNINHICILADNFKNIKINKPFVVLIFNCTFSQCPANYNFYLTNNILNNNTSLIFTVEQSGPILHRKGATKANFISKYKRTELAKNLIKDKESADNLVYEILNN